ncbi:uncharacterized protein LOC125654717 isoform X2 [Ostrea edulis]|nr:uncharacterized protein LOC125654717 isoform X2 [Ostrea edulis]
MKSIGIVVVLLFLPLCHGQDNNSSSVHGEMTGATQTHSSITPPSIPAATSDKSTSTETYIFPENSKIIDELLQKFGTEFLKNLGSITARCAIEQLITQYRNVFQNACSSTKLQEIGNQINDYCQSEMHCLLSLNRDNGNGIQVCIYSTFKTEPCPKIEISKQMLCDDLYMITLNCSLVQQDPGTTTPIPSPKTNNSQNKDDPGGYIGAAFGGFIFGVLLVTLGVFIMYRRHQKQMERETASVSSRKYPNLRRPLPTPRKDDDIYNQIDDSEDNGQAKLRNKSDTHFESEIHSHVKDTKSSDEHTSDHYSKSTKRHTGLNGFYSFDPRKSVDVTVQEESTKYGILNSSDLGGKTISPETDSMGYLSASKLSKVQSMKGTDNNGNFTEVATIQEEGDSTVCEESKLKTDENFTEDMECSDYRDSEEWFTDEVRNEHAKTQDVSDDMCEQTVRHSEEWITDEVITKKEALNDDMEDATYRHSEDWFVDEARNEKEEKKEICDDMDEPTYRHSEDWFADELRNEEEEKKEICDDMEDATYRHPEDWFVDELRNEEEEKKETCDDMDEPTYRHSKNWLEEEVTNKKVEKHDSPGKEIPNKETDNYYILESMESQA